MRNEPDTRPVHAPMNGLSQPLAGALSPRDKRTLLAELLKKQIHQPRHVALSSGQQRLWLVHELDPANTVYNIAIAYDFRGPVDGAAFEQALRRVVQRHESLRTTFARVDGQPVQVVAPAANIPLARVDLPQPSDAGWARAVEHLAAEEARAAFDLRKGPLARFKLVSRSAREHALLVTIHHIIADRWSLGILAKELSAFYSALVGGGASPPAGPPAQYGEFTSWEQEWLRSEAFDAQLAYWETKLGGRVPELQLPSDRRAAAAPTYQGGRKQFELGAELTSDLIALSSREGVTLYATMLAAFATLLHRHTGQEDVLVCTPVAGRHRPATRGMVGYFNNIVPLRLDVSGVPTFASLLKRVNQTFREALESQDVPLQRIAASPSLSLTRLTRCMFALQNTPSLSIDLPGVTSTYRDVHNQAANFELAVFFEQRGNDLTGIVDFKTDSFSGAAADLLVQRYRALLRDVAASPERRLAEFPAFHDRAGRTAPAESVGPGPDSRPADTPPDMHESELERRLTLLWEDVLGIRPVDPTASFFDLGGHSLLAARLFARIADEFGKELPLALLLRAPTVRLMSKELMRGGWSELWSSLVPLQPRGTRPPFFFVHGGGGNVVSFRRLVECLGDDQPLWAFQAKAMNRLEAPLASVEQMAEHYLTAMRSQQPEGPYFLGGYSFGGLVALEMAQRLYAEGQRVPLLLILDYPGPASQVRWRDWLQWQRIFLSQLGMRDKVTYITSRVRWHFSGSSWIPRSIRLAASLNRQRPSFAAASSRLRPLENALAALKSYVIKPYPGKLTLFRTRRAVMYADAHGGWKETAMGGVEVYDLPGSHLSIMEGPDVQFFGAVLKNCLTTAQALG